jgi:hypothetical protein
MVECDRKLLVFSPTPEPEFADKEFVADQCLKPFLKIILF